ncbi:MAG: sulfotransferase [Planctomycetota bacterium]
MPHPLLSFPMLLVNGQARSGTTVLTKAIGAHPAVLSNMRESNYIDDVTRLLKNNLAKQNVLNQLPGTEEDFRLQFRNATMNVLFPQRMFAADDETRCVSTFSSLRIDVADGLHDLFPGMRLALIIRNGHEVVSSRRIHDHIGRLSFDKHCTAWSKSVNMLEWCEGRDDTYVFRHEDLRHEETCRRVFKEMQVSFDLPHSEAPADFVLHKMINTKESSDESVTSKSTDERADQLEERSRRWESWSDQERRMFEEICTPAMERCGYQIPWRG